MLKDIVSVTPLGNHRLHLRFEDGVSGEVDIAAIVRFDGVFAPLRDPAYFAQVHVNQDIGTIIWPNGADLDPDVLYAIITGNKIDTHQAA
jgi:hypothetical protein